jgi:hypothetical protein
VFDAAGGGVLAQSASVVKPGGTLVSVAAFPPFGRKDAREIFFIQEQSRAQLSEPARLVDEGHLRPQAGAVYPLTEATRACRIGTAASREAVIELEQKRISRSWQPDATTSRWRPQLDPGLRMFRLVRLSTSSACVPAHCVHLGGERGRLDDWGPAPRRH